MGGNFIDEAGRNDAFKEDLVGQELLEMLVKSSGLPEEYTRRKLTMMLQAAGKSENDFTLDDVRELLADLLMDLIDESSKDELAG
jgi:hypothetical protein